MLMTVDIPSDLATRLYPFEQELPQVLELGLHEFTLPKQNGFHGLGNILEFLASVPTAEQVMALRSSESLQNQVNELLEKQRQGMLNTIEQQLQQFEYVEHLVRLAKANAMLKLKAAVVDCGGFSF